MTSLTEQFHDAVLRRDVALVAECIRLGADVNTPDPQNGCSPLHEAAQRGPAEIVQQLLEAGANPNHKSTRGHTPLHYACSEPDPVAVRLLLEHGGNPNSSDGRGFTPLHCAAGHGSEEITSLLLAHGANPNTRSTYLGLVALHEAQGEQVILMLVNAGANLEAADDSGQTPLDWALDDDRFEDADVIKRLIVQRNRK